MNNTLKKLIEGVNYNTSVRTNCPFCNGTNTFSITNEGSVVKYHCFRNSCDSHKSSGSIEQLPLHEDIVFKSKVRAATDVKQDFLLPTYLRRGLSSKTAFNWILEHNGLESYNRGMYKVAYDPVQDRLVYLLNEGGKTVGAIGRTLCFAQPKTIIYENSKIMPFIAGDSEIGVIVEDCASAASINSIDKYTGIALLGTYLKNEYIPYLQAFKRLVVALDPDAKKKALEIKNNLQYICKYVQVWNIPTDFKNMTKEEIWRFINE
jgi:hypothetical protein